MNIYIIRHGEAEKSTAGKSDGERELTPDGILQVEISSQFWKQFINKFDLILSSPLRRAIQTAEIVKNVFNVESEIVKENSLLNDGSTDELLNIVSAFSADETALVGHQPDIAEHISRMIGQSEINIKIPPATIAKISFKESMNIGKGKLEFLIPPINKKG